MKRSEETYEDFELNSPREEVGKASGEHPQVPVSRQTVSSTSGRVAIGGNVRDSTIQATCVQITNGKIPPEILTLLKQQKGIHIPYPQNVNFTGRDKSLSDLRAALQSENKVVLTGLGGIGKTQMALEYSYRYQDDYDIVWWLRSELFSTLLDDYASMTVSLKLLEWDSEDLKLVAEAARRFLETRSRWLLVFDNAQDPRDIKPYLPHGGGGHVIITSRTPIWGNLARSMVVPRFERSESSKFLIKRTGQQDRKSAGELAEALGDLPLALEQAGAYIEIMAKPLSEYLKTFQERKLEVLAKSRPSDYPETVATTWKMSFQAVQKDYPAASELLRLFSYLGPDDLPLAYLVKGSVHLNGHVASILQDEDVRNEAVAALRRYSLINISENKISVHRLVQAVTRDNLTLKEQKDWVSAVITLLNNEFNKNLPYKGQSLTECSILLPHALTAARHAQELGMEHALVPMVEVGLNLANFQRIDRSFDLAQKTLDEVEAALKPLEFEMKGMAYDKNRLMAQMFHYRGLVLGLGLMGEIEDKLKGIDYCNRALDYANRAGDIKRKAAILNACGLINYQLAQKTYNNLNVAENSSSDLFNEQIVDYLQAAENSLHESLALYAGLLDPRSSFQPLRNLILVHLLRAEHSNPFDQDHWYREALNDVNHCQRYLDQVNIGSSEPSGDRIELDFRRANILGKLGNKEDARSIQKLVLSHWEKKNDMHQQARSWLELLDLAEDRTMMREGAYKLVEIVGIILNSPEERMRYNKDRLRLENHWKMLHNASTAARKTDDKECLSRIAHLAELGRKIAEELNDRNLFLKFDTLAQCHFGE